MYEIISTTQIRWIGINKINSSNVTGLSLQNTKLSITAVVDLNAFHLNPSHAKNHT